MSMWRQYEADAAPDVLDDTSSANYVYVNRNIHEETRYDEETETEKIVFVFEQAKIHRDIYDIFKEQQKNTNDISEIEDVLAEILFGGDE